MKNNKLIFWLLSLTWGLPMTLIGAAAALFLRWRAYIPTRFGPCWVFVVGERWGGVNLGPIILVSKGSGSNTINHEIGHALQNCIWGPLFPFVIAIPSVIRYWIREQEGYIKKIKFSAIFDIALMIICIISLVLIWFDTAIMITLLLTFIELYLLIIVSWLDWKELPQYKNEQSPSYDDIWFEGQATRWGIEFMDNEEK